MTTSTAPLTADLESFDNVATARVYRESAPSIIVHDPVWNFAGLWVTTRSEAAAGSEIRTFMPWHTIRRVDVITPRVGTAEPDMSALLDDGPF